MKFREIFVEKRRFLQLNSDVLFHCIVINFSTVKVYYRSHLNITRALIEASKTRLKSVAKCYKRLQKAIKGCKRLHKVAKGYNRLQKPAKGCKSLQKAAKGYKRLQKAVKGYKRL